MREIILDTETTGFDPLSGDRMVEVAAVEMFERVLTGRSFHCYFNPQRDMPTAAEAVHGLSADFLADKPLFREKAQELINFVGDASIIAHNASFDARFLAFELERAGHKPWPNDRYIDTLELARVRFPGAKHTLDALCQRFGIDRSARTVHGALIDAMLLADVYVELTGGRQIGFDLAVDQPGLAVPAAERRVRPARVFEVPEAERERHAQFLSRLAEPIWRRAAS